ncbi:glucuronoxylan 4-O-methyltransferase 1 [Malania oleifera]|uniref:glucuronoxylan 4-O-methyltransferase 1 n=1 Tax=Malania oleifera TaxID=397392 RepID=UPI0025AEB3C4|nr:glucuronoxylan 4-O-methyltransferase 1 [Malania oleifera]
MPPDASHYHLPTSSPAQPFLPSSLKLKPDLCFIYRCCQAGAKIKLTRKRLIPVLVLILASISVLRLLRITIKTSSPSTTPPLSARPPTLLLTRASPTLTHWKAQTQAWSTLTNQDNASVTAPALSGKEFEFLSNIVSSKAPCNLLVFGLHPQYLAFSSINAGGLTVFLEDNPERFQTIRTNSNSTRIYNVEHRIPAGKAYRLLKKARKNPACVLRSEPLKEYSSCQLALTKLPREVYEVKWDLVVVDGPSGDRPEAPGRMAAIYTASVIARSGNMTHVVVHDVDRTIEKWFSWEFLCEENLVSSKGKLWNFKIEGQSNSTRFCQERTKLSFLKVNDTASS